MILDADLRKRKLRDKRADHLRHQRALHRPHGPRRRRRQQGADGIRAAPAPHQVDHERSGRRGHGHRIEGDRGGRRRQAEEAARRAVQVRDDAARVQGRRCGRCRARPVQSARLRADRRTPALAEVPEHLLGGRLRRDPAGRGHAGARRRAEDRLHDRVDGVAICENIVPRSRASRRRRRHLERDLHRRLRRSRRGLRRAAADSAAQRDLGAEGKWVHWPRSRSRSTSCTRCAPVRWRPSTRPTSSRRSASCR
jgi:hypothetical protein